MVQILRFTGRLALVLAAAIGMASAQVPVLSSHSASDHATSRIKGDWRASASVRIAGSVPPLPKPVSRQGRAPAGVRLERVLLLLEPAESQRAALDAELATQQNASSSEYHHWLKPAAFADAYANSSSDVAAVTAWLSARGLSVAAVPAGRGWIEFAGTVGQVEQAFETQIDVSVVGGETRYSLARPMAVPAALRPLIHGMVSLDSMRAVSAMTAPLSMTGSAKEVAAATTLAKAGALTPQLLAQSMHLDTLQATSATGAGETIAVPGRGGIRASDVAAFRSTFGLPANAVRVVPAGSNSGLGSGAGADTGDQAEATLVASWAGAAAPEAQIVVTQASTTTATDGLDLALAAVVDSAAANTVVVGYSACEAAMSEAHQAFYAALYRQAAAQGMAVIAAAGDSGASACHAAGSDASVTSGYGVSALASTPWNTAMGAAGISQQGAPAANLKGWSPVTPGDRDYAGGGGASAVYKVPAWQPLPEEGMNRPAASGYARLVPDLALPTGMDSGASPGLAFCFAGSGTAEASEGCSLVRAGGSAAAAAVFAGVAAIVAQKYGPQGNVAPRLYELSRRPGLFEDVQEGDARLSCVSGTPGCDASGKIGFSATTGYDLATGLGSVDAHALVTAWATPMTTGAGAATVSLAVTPAVANTTYNPTAQITLTATVVSGTGGATPTGTVTFVDASTGTNLGGAAAAVGTNGTASVMVSSGLAIGGNSVTALYSGDATYASTSSQVLVVTAEPSTTSLVVIPSTTTPAAGATITVTTTLAVASPPEGTVAPSGKVTLNLDGLPTATASVTASAAGATASFSVTIPSAGVHTLQVVYAGDTNYNASTSPAVTVTATKGATVTSLTATPATLTAGTAETFTATIAPASAATGATYSLTGTVNFYDGTTLLGTAVVNANSASLANVTLSAATLHTISAVYSGDTSWAASTSNAITLQSVLMPDTVTLAVNVTTAGPGQSIALTATVTPVGIPATNVEQNPTGKVVFYDGTTVLGTSTLGASLNYSSTVTLITGSLPGGQNVLTAVYLGDLYYAPGTSTPVTIDVQDFTLTASPGSSGTNLTIPKGSAGTASFVVTGLGGFANQIQVVCAVPTQDDMTCEASPQQVTPTGTVMFTVQTFAAGGPTTARRGVPPMWSRAVGGTALALLAFFVLPVGSRVRERLAEAAGDRVTRAFLLALFLLGMGGGGIGCSSTTTAPQNTGTPLGVATLKVTATAYVDNAVVSRSLSLTVNVVPPS